MSTRATYTIKEEKKTTHLYIHYDGYPEGAAEYFKQLVNVENKRGGIVCQFIRAIDLSEFTNNPDNHGDTEYHYELEAKSYMLKAYKIYRNWEDDQKTTKNCFFYGNLAEFLNRYLPEEERSYMYFEQKSFNSSYVEIIKKEKLEYRYTEKMNRCLFLLAAGHIGNASGELDEAAKINDFLEYAPKPEMLFAAKHFVESYEHDKTPEEWINKLCLNK